MKFGEVCMFLGRCVYFRVAGYVLGKVCSGHKLSLGQVCMF